MRNQNPSRSGITIAALLGAVALTTLGSSAQAGLIGFNPTGGAATSVMPIAGIDLAPGNALTRGVATPVVGQTFQLYYQASVDGFVDPNGLTTSATDPDSNYQLTAVGSFTEVVTGVDGSGAATFMLASSQSSDSFFALYYNSSVVRNYGTGAGFNQGTLILSGTPAVGGVSQGTLPPTQGGAGSFKLSLDVTTFDPAFFLAPLTRIGIDSTLIAPNVANPSAAYNSTAGAGAPGVLFDPSTDTRYGADAGITFTTAAAAAAAVPEPTSLIQAGLGLLAVSTGLGWRKLRTGGPRV